MHCKQKIGIHVLSKHLENCEQRYFLQLNLHFNEYVVCTSCIVTN